MTLTSARRNITITFFYLAAKVLQNEIVASGPDSRLQSLKFFFCASVQALVVSRWLLGSGPAWGARGHRHLGTRIGIPGLSRRVVSLQKRLNVIGISSVELLLIMWVQQQHNTVGIWIPSIHIMEPFKLWLTVSPLFEWSA